MKKLTKEQMIIVAEEIQKLNSKLYDECTNDDCNVYEMIGRITYQIDQLTCMIKHGYVNYYDFETVLKTIVI